MRKPLQNPGLCKRQAIGLGLSATALLALAWNVKAQTPGLPDVSFNGTGKLVTNTPNNYPSSHGEAIGIQNNGRIVIAGSIGDSRYLAALQENGTFSTGWGNGSAIGVNDDNYCSSGCTSGLNALKMMGTSEFIAVGWTKTMGSTSGKRFFLNKYASSGVGLWSVPVFNGRGEDLSSGDDIAYDLELQADGRILLVGSADAVIGVARFDTDGWLDLSYADAGEQLIDITNGDEERATACHLTPDGKLVLVGWVGYGTDYQGVVFQLDTNGDLDPSFSNDGVTDGWQELEFIPGASSFLTDVHITDNGDIYLLGDVLDQGRNWALAKLTANGQLVPGFGGDGTVSLDLDMPIDLSAALAWQSDGKLIVVGSTGNLTDGQTCVARYLSNGTLDNTFGTGGLSCVQIEDLSFPADVTIDAMGRIVVVGTSYNEFMAPSTYVMRMLSGLNVGVMEFSIHEDILNVYPNPIAETTILRYILAESQELTIALHDLQGRVLAAYLNGKDMPAGEHTQTITMPSDLASGNYLLVFSSPKGKMSVQVTKAD